MNNSDCPACGASCSENQKFCASCGASLIREESHSIVHDKKGRPPILRKASPWTCGILCCTAALLIMLIILSVLAFRTPLKSLFHRPASPAPSGKPAVEKAASKESFRIGTPPPGAVIARAVIGTQGGIVEAPGRIKIGIPEGALGESGEIVIRDSPGCPADYPIFHVDSAQPLHFKRPVKVTLSLPRSIDAASAVPIQGFENGVFLTKEGLYDRTSHTISFKTSHFTPVSWAKLQKTAYGVASTGAGLIIIVGWSNPISLTGYMAIGVVSLGFGSTVTAPAIQKYLNEGINTEPLSTHHFDFFYADAGKDTIPEEEEAALFDVTENNGRATFLFDGNGRLVDVETLSIEECREKYPELKGREVSRPLLILAWELEKAWNYYHRASYCPPDRLPVIITSDMEENREGDKNYGEFVEGAAGQVGYLRMHPRYIISSSLSSEVVRGRRATLSHEYWHAVWAHNRYGNDYPWTEEALATTFESEIFPDTLIYSDSRKWNTFFYVLANGLSCPGPDDTGGMEDPVKRGYSLWPWGKFLLHRRGDNDHALVRRFITEGGFDRETMEEHFKSFAESLYASDHHLPDRVTQKPEVYRFKGKALEVPTGWKELGDNPNPYRGTFRTGAVSAKQLLQPRSLSAAFLKITPGAPPLLKNCTAAPPLVIRRKEPESRETFVLPPSAVKPDYALSGHGGIALSQEVLKNPALFSTGFSLALINSSTSCEKREGWQGADNGLLVYYLIPPRQVAVGAPQPDPASGTNRYSLAWEKPVPGEGLKAQDCYNCYRLVVKNSSGKEFILDDLFLDPAKSTAEISILPLYRPVGMVSQDKGIRGAGGTFLCSPVWRLDADEPVADQWYKGFISAGPPKSGSRFQHFADTFAYIDPENRRLSLYSIGFIKKSASGSNLETWITNEDLHYQKDGSFSFTDKVGNRITGKVENKGERIALTIAWKDHYDRSGLNGILNLMSTATPSPGGTAPVLITPAGAYRIVLDYPAGRRDPAYREK